MALIVSVLEILVLWMEMCHWKPGLTIEMTKCWLLFVFTQAASLLTASSLFSSNHTLQVWQKAYVTRLQVQRTQWIRKQFAVQPFQSFPIPQIFINHMPFVIYGMSAISVKLFLQLFIIICGVFESFIHIDLFIHPNIRSKYKTFALNFPPSNRNDTTPNTTYLVYYILHCLMPWNNS